MRRRQAFEEVFAKHRIVFVDAENKTSEPEPEKSLPKLNPLRPRRNRRKHEDLKLEAELVFGPKIRKDIANEANKLFIKDIKFEGIKRESKKKTQSVKQIRDYYIRRLRHERMRHVANDDIELKKLISKEMVPHAKWLGSDNIGAYWTKK